ncbi:MAG TPA: hypothetical protein VN047_10700 [Sphingopyxis sp.]|uniref:hypothetical protein n=1 Tax=Sphingopyxis sp. TaxID=1908224 RepID=UPI002BAC0EBF|nr:hypothetical protein [Sphingopyxis sp.]HWW57348.1 hypothetical protein [Sphingopyxis sp.]
MRFLDILMAFPLLASLSGLPEAGRPERQVGTLPLNPADEVLQTTANMSAYLMCSCLFVEKADERACRSDVVSTDKRLVIAPDFQQSLVRVSYGRWNGVARLQTLAQGCRLD